MTWPVTWRMAWPVTWPRAVTWPVTWARAHSRLHELRVDAPDGLHEGEAEGARLEAAPTRG